MRDIIKKIIPIAAKKQYWRYLKRKQKAKKKRISFKGKTPKEAFTYIYNTNHWNGQESISGGGSDAMHTKIVIKSINVLVKELEIKSILDVPCGDFAWMQYVNLLDAEYIGGDIVDDLITDNIKKFKTRDKVNFKVIDLVKDPLTKSDIIINRDCLVHLSFKDIYAAIKNIKNSGSKYLLTTTFPKHDINKDITTGDWRALNFEKAPFNFGPPIKLINEKFNHQDFSDKSLALWEIGDLTVQEKANN